MKETLRNHIRLVEKILLQENADWAAVLAWHRAQIGFFQHERLIHLLITIFFGFVFMLMVMTGLLLVNFALMTVSIILAVVLLFYIWHYFVLENGVQKLYALDNKIQERCQKFN